MITKSEKSVPKFLQNGGEMGRILNDKNWHTHPLGQPENWPLSLKFSISSMLKTAFPNFIFWGKDFRCFYNDAYRPSLGKEGKHPFILGQKADEAWPEIWATIEPLLRHVWKTGEATWSENQLIPFYRNGQIENIYWTFSYSALMGEDEKIAGILTTCTETTDAVLNLQRLEESEEQLRFAIDAAELGTWDYNPKTNKFLANERLKDWLGVDAGKEVKLPKALEAIIVQDRDRVAESIKNVLLGANNGKYDVTYSLKNLKSEQVRIVRSLGKASFDENGVGYRFNGTTQDVTEQVASERKLRLANSRIRKEEQRFRNVVHNAPVGIAVFTGKEYRFEMANVAYSEILQRPTEVLIGKPLFDVLPEVKEVVAPWFEKVRKKGKAVYDNEFKVPLNRKGKIRDAYFNLIFHPLQNVDESVLDVMVVANEVTDYVIARNILAQNENRFRHLIMQSPVAMAILRGEDLYIEMANDKILNHFWKKSLEEVVGKKLIDVFPEIAEQLHFDEIKSVMLTGKPIRNQHSKSIVFHNHEKREFYVNYDYLPLTELDDTVSGVFISATDVTKQYLSKEKLVNFSKELEKQVQERTEMHRNANDKLKHSVKKLEEANAELESFAYVSSHDLQEPLRKIQMFISRFEEEESDDLTDSGKQYFKKISDSARRMRVLIDDLLAFSRTEDDRSKLEATDLNHIVEQVLDNLSSQIERTGANISTSDLPTVDAIPFQMRQVFSNLVGNALKFSAENKSPNISLHSENAKTKSLKKLGLSTTNKYHKISVKDNGIGFASGMEDKIFEVFQRLHGKQEYEGTGIGLAIVKKIMYNHDGAVTADSIQGEGATFSIYLPK